MSKISGYFIKNWVGYALVVSNWMIFLFGLFLMNDKKDQEMFVISTIVLILNLIPVAISFFLTYPLIPAVSDTVYGIAVIGLMLLTIALQWLFLGKKIADFFLRRGANDESLSIIDNTTPQVLLNVGGRTNYAGSE